MRLWSIHPKYLDVKGLIALWREALLAKNVLENKTKGYKNHPQLYRFKNQSATKTLINCYLKTIYAESKKRKFAFDQTKIGKLSKYKKIPVTSGQIAYEFKHLLKKLKKRDQVKYNKYKEIKTIALNPIFKKVSGNIENWEKIKYKQKHARANTPP